MDFDTKLERTLRRRELLRETLRRHRQHKTLAEAPRVMQEGPYYWIPLPGDRWELMSWYVSDYGIDKTDHVRVWRDSASHYMAEQWGIDQGRLARIPYCVPRGRVSKGYKAIFINHGDDAPVPKDSMVRQVCKEFNLTGILLNNPEKIKVALDNHERMSSRDKAELQTLLASAQKIA